MGDLHQHSTWAMHRSRGNRTQVQIFGRDTNLHSVWTLQSQKSAHKWSYTEWAEPD
ncbi:hypothetical protein [Duncaniella dubosii]|uniref:hypothetical protein n=1 Tax=Duncaniella dubosii TaxID=2518971 RepID=UPI003F66ABA0